jgi:hypothetical protein
MCWTCEGDVVVLVRGLPAWTCREGIMCIRRRLVRLVKTQREISKFCNRSLIIAHFIRKWTWQTPSVLSRIPPCGQRPSSQYVYISSRAILLKGLFSKVIQPLPGRGYAITSQAGPSCALHLLHDGDDALVQRVVLLQAGDFGCSLLGRLLLEDLGELDRLLVALDVLEAEGLLGGTK